MADSLRHALVRRLALSFGALFLLLLPLVYLLVQRPALQAYDHDVADAALALVPHLKLEGGQARFVFPAEAEQVIRTDSYDQIYFLVLGPDRAYLAGDRDLPVPAALERELKPGTPLMYDAVYKGRSIRVAAVADRALGRQYLFFTAETMHKRDLLSKNAAIAILLAMLLLVLVSGFTVWYHVHRALAPIEVIRSSLQHIEHHNLQRLDEARAPSEIRSLVHEFNALLDRLQAASAAQQRFVANAAHQLRTPLAGMRAQLELVQTQADPEVRTRRIADCIAAIDRLSHLVHQMLALLSSVPGGREQLHHAVVNLPALILERSTQWVHAAAAHGTELGFDLHPARVYGDSLLLGEMIGNLVDNALTYTPQGSEVTVRCLERGGKALLEVEDNGPGIPAGERALVFERFYRLAGTQVYGSGLGLAIVHEIAAGMGGRAWADTAADGKGCLMRVELPAYVPAASAPIASQ